MDLGCIQVTRTARSASVKARHKIHNRSCVVIKTKFLPMDFSKLVTHGASEDLCMMVLVQQTMLEKFWT